MSKERYTQKLLKSTSKNTTSKKPKNVEDKVQNVDVKPTKLKPTKLKPTKPTKLKPTKLTKTITEVSEVENSKVEVKKLETPELEKLKVSELDSWDSLLTDLNSNSEIIIPTVYRSVKKEVIIVEQPKPTGCLSCGGVLHLHINMFICQSCGLEATSATNTTEEEYSTAALTDCNVNVNGFIAMKMVGRGAYKYQRSLLKTCANYSVFRKNNTLKDMKNWNSQSVKNHLPKNVMQEANDMFAKIKEQGYVFRKDGRKGVMSACIYYACYNNGLTKTPSEIAQFSGIEEKFHSQGDRILHALNEKNIISIPAKINPISDYLDRYLELLNINKKYKPFLIDLIYRAEKKRIHILHDSKHNTKCVGAIYMLIDRVPELHTITKEKIDQVCGISKTTFIRYYNVLCEYYKLIKKVFKKHGIYMKAGWH